MTDGPCVAGVPSEQPRVAFQGERGAFSEAAIVALFGTTVDTLPQRDFAAVAAAVIAGTADYGVLPVENSIYGTVQAAVAVIDSAALVIARDIVCPIRLCLLAVPGASQDSLRRVLSHPVALGQCRRFLAGLPAVTPADFYDTAGAAREVARRATPDNAAVASRAAAARYGLIVLAENIEDGADNRTRFVLVSRPTAR